MEVFLGLTSQQWQDVGISAGIVLLTVLIGRWLIQLVLRQILGRLAGRTQTEFDDQLLDVLRPSLYLLAIVVSVQIGLERLGFLLPTFAREEVFYVLYFMTAFFFSWLFISKMFQWYAREVAPKTESQLDEQLFPFFRRVVLIVLIIAGAIILLGHFDVNVSALVTTLGVGSLAVALAAQEALADTIAGFVIMVDRPFRLGDRIEIQDLSTWGDVVDIGLRSTRIRTLDNRMVIVPNAVIGKSLVVNHSFPNTLYRIQNHVGVAYGSELERTRRTLVKAVKTVEGVSPDHPVEALFLEFGDSALVFRVRWWIESYSDTRIMFDQVNTAIYKALKEEGIEIPFPQRDVHHKIDPETAARIPLAVRQPQG